MKVKVTYPMLKEIKKALPKYNVSLEKYTLEQYERFVDFDVYRNEIDYDDKTGKMKVIKIIYPDSYYAMPRYLTTKDLSQIFKYSDKTYNGFIKELVDYCEI